MAMVTSQAATSVSLYLGGGSCRLELRLRGADDRALPRLTASLLAASLLHCELNELAYDEINFVEKL